MAPTETCLALRGPLRRADLPGLQARVCQALEAATGRSLVLDVAELATDAVTVEALCRLKVGAGRREGRVRFRNAAPELVAIILFMGLGEAIGPELGVEVEG